MADIEKTVDQFVLLPAGVGKPQVSRLRA